MASLARAVYEDPSVNPTDLLDDRFASADALEKHLLEAFIPAVYSLIPSNTPSASARVRCQPQQAHDWLRFLAHHLNQRKTRDLAWWQMIDAVPRLTRGLVAGLVFGLMFGLLGEFVAGPMCGLTYMLAFGIASGLSFGLGQQSRPSHVEVRFRGTAKPFFCRFTVGLTIGFLLGFVYALPAEAVLVVGLAFGLAVGLHEWLGKPADAEGASSPLTVLKQDRTATLAFGFSFALPLGLIYGLSVIFTDEHAGGPKLGFVFELSFAPSFALAGAAAGMVVGWLALGRIGAVAYSLAGAVMTGLLIPRTNAIVSGLVVGLMFGLLIGSLGVLSKPWGAFVFSRTWLALRGHQPWRLMRFLEDARNPRGVLRQAGGVYQFRHTSLQDQLTEPSKGTSRSTGRRSLRTVLTGATAVDR
jgi:hypothetical protein